MFYAGSIKFNILALYIGSVRTNDSVPRLIKEYVILYTYKSSSQYHLNTDDNHFPNISVVLLA